MAKRQVFYSFHYDNDNWRAAQVRNIGAIEGNRPAPDNDWESIKKGGDRAIENWIDSQLRYRSCTVVLIGTSTAGRRWINYEIEKSWKEGLGVLGIHIHNLKDRLGYQSLQGPNPFNKYINHIHLLSNIVKTYNPPFLDSQRVYQHISENISSWVEQAIEIRNRF